MGGASVATTGTFSEVLELMLGTRDAINDWLKRRREEAKAEGLAEGLRKGWQRDWRKDSQKENLKGWQKPNLGTCVSKPRGKRANHLMNLLHGMGMTHKITTTNY